jgi:hypothetical protein
MNARKHRKICGAIRDCLRLRPKGKQSGSGPSTWPDANIRTAGVKSEPKSSGVIVVEHGKAVDLVQTVWTDLTARRVSGRSIGMTEEAKASGNALDMLTSVWSEMTRKQAEPHTSRKANDGQRPLADASESCCPKEQRLCGCLQRTVKLSGVGQRVHPR